MIVEDGSAPLTSLKVADAIAEPKIDAKVTGKGAQRTLTYDVTKDPSQTVTFIERGPSTSGDDRRRGQADRRAEASRPPAARARSARSSRSSSRTAWSPTSSSSAATARRRSTGRVSSRASRRPSAAPRLAVSWKASAGAERYVVTLTLSDGRRVVKQVSSRSLTLRTTARAKRVTVRAVTADGMVGR